MNASLRWELCCVALSIFLTALILESKMIVSRCLLNSPCYVSFLRSGKFAVVFVSKTASGTWQVLNKYLNTQLSDLGALVC